MPSRRRWFDRGIGQSFRFLCHTLLPLQEQQDRIGLCRGQSMRGLATIIQIVEKRLVLLGRQCDLQGLWLSHGCRSRLGSRRRGGRCALSLGKSGQSKKRKGGSGG